MHHYPGPPWKQALWYLYQYEPTIVVYPNLRLLLGVNVVTLASSNIAPPPPPMDASKSLILYSPRQNGKAYAISAMLAVMLKKYLLSQAEKLEARLIPNPYRLYQRK